MNTHIGAASLAASLGLKHVRVSGVAVVELVDACAGPLLFKGVRFFLVNPPELKFDFQSHTSSLLNINAVKKVITEVVSEQIAHGLVTPNGVGFLLDPQADFF